MSTMTLAGTMRAQMEALVRERQDAICRAIEHLEGPAGARFRQDEWSRPGGGGGTTRVLQQGAVFEKAGVNVSAVHGLLSPEAARGAAGPDYLSGGDPAGHPADGPVPFFAASLSLVLHPHNPMAPTAHANYRYFELGDGAAPEAWWFGGGADLTPAYLFEEDAAHFHRAHKAACDRYDATLYPRLKRACDEYFFLPHRGERRGVGGIFFDRLTGDDREGLFALVRDCADAFVPAYLPVVAARKDAPFTAAQRRWQGLRRGRYVEFNLVYDRGTLFGFKTGGRAESILMSLPLVARWEYDHQPGPGSPEALLVEVLRTPREWA
ncbi:MAG TPA: oxygen-dependent coproporphyrinogen oxidase [Chloroflexota bacterium]|nr:oxygen-dependent coproporphyrinogen oxidase [Chloroflexota bacterium]